MKYDSCLARNTRISRGNLLQSVNQSELSIQSDDPQLTNQSSVSWLRFNGCQASRRWGELFVSQTLYSIIRINADKLNEIEKYCRNLVLGTFCESFICSVLKSLCFVASPEFSYFLISHKRFKMVFKCNFIPNETFFSILPVWLKTSWVYGNFYGAARTSKTIGN